MNPDLTRLRHEDPDQFASEYVSGQLAADRAFKLEITKNGPDDIPNRVVYMAESEELANLILPAQVGAGKLATPPELLSLCCRFARDQFGPPFLVGFLSEAYMQTFAPDEAAKARKLRRGEITRRFERGNPRVVECLGVTMMHRRLDGSLRSIAVHQPFRYEGGTVVFDDEQWIDSLEHETVASSTGALMDAMTAAFGGEHN